MYRFRRNSTLWGWGTAQWAQSLPHKQKDLNLYPQCSQKNVRYRESFGGVKSGASSGLSGLLCSINELKVQREMLAQAIDREQWIKIPNINLWPLHANTCVCVHTHIHAHTHDSVYPQTHIFLKYKGWVFSIMAEVVYLNIPGDGFLYDCRRHLLERMMHTITRMPLLTMGLEIMFQSCSTASCCHHFSYQRKCFLASCINSSTQCSYLRLIGFCLVCIKFVKAQEPTLYGSNLIASSVF